MNIKYTSPLEHNWLMSFKFEVKRHVPPGSHTAFQRTSLRQKVSSREILQALDTTYEVLIRGCKLLTLRQRDQGVRVLACRSIFSGSSRHLQQTHMKQGYALSGVLVCRSSCTGSVKVHLEAGVCLVRLTLSFVRSSSHNEIHAVSGPGLRPAYVLVAVQANQLANYLRCIPVRQGNHDLALLSRSPTLNVLLAYGK